MNILNTILSITCGIVVGVIAGAIIGSSAIPYLSFLHLSPDVITSGFASLGVVVGITLALKNQAEDKAE